MKDIEVRKGPGGNSEYIAGTRTRVTDIARLFRITQDELVTERICESLPHLRPAQVRAAADWWREHAAEIEEEIAEERKLLEQVPVK